MNKRTFKQRLLSFNQFLIKDGLFINLTTDRDEPGYMTVSIFNFNQTPIAFVKVYMDVEDNRLVLDRGETYSAYRRSGIGTKLRAIIVWSAKHSGFVRAEQTSTNLYKNNPGKRPFSAYIMNKLGFTVNRYLDNGKFSENRSLNLNRNTPQLNAIIASIKQ
jgi:hypothetical protein